MQLAFRNVHVAYPNSEKATLNAISFHVEPGERVALLGLNGSGKTTLLKAIVGLLPHEGEIRLDDLPVEPASLAEVRRKVGFLFNVPEDQLLFPRVLDDVAFGLRRQGIAKQECMRIAQTALADMGVSDLAERAVYDLSHGQKLRVALAGILLTKPNVLLLDEPTAGLDPPGKHQLADVLMTLDASMLVATHDIEFAKRVCRRALLLTPNESGITETSFEVMLEAWKET